MAAATIRSRVASADGRVTRALVVVDALRHPGSLIN